MTANASPWRGLGSLNLRPGSMPTPKDDEPDDFARPSVKRTVPAAGAPSVLPPGAVVSPFAHPFPASAGSADDDKPENSAAATHHEEKTDMPRKPEAKARKPRPTKGASARFQICALLMSKGQLTREQLLADVSADRTAFTNAIFNAKAAGHIVYLQSADVYKITKEGRDWTSGGANLDNHKATAAEPKHAKRAKKAKPAPVKAARAKPGRKVRQPRAAQTAQFATPAAGTALAVRDFEPVVERSFRCAVFSDGAFHLAKNGQAIDLTAAEFREAVRYLDRMAETPAPAA